MRALEPKLFGSDVLRRAGHPRLCLFITSVSAAGFAVRGEKSLLHATRNYRISGSVR